MDLRSSTDTDRRVKKVHRNLEQCEAILQRAKDLAGRQKFHSEMVVYTGTFSSLAEGIKYMPSMETNERRLSNDAVTKEQKLMSHISVINRTPRETKFDRNSFSSSKNYHSDVTERLERSTTKPMTLNNYSTCAPAKFCDPPNVTKEPRRYRHVRMLKDFAVKKCPLVQAGNTQRSYPEIEVTYSRILFSTRAFIILNCRSLIKKGYMYVSRQQQ